MSESFLHPCELAVIDKLPEKPLVLDAGAFIGEFTEAVLERRPEAHILAFEPQPGCREHLEALGDHVKVYQLALGSAPERRELMSDFPTSVLATFHERPSLPLDLKQRDMVEVTTVTLFQRDRLDLLKIDCEGHELEILRGTDLGRVDRIIWEHCEGPSRWTDATVQDFRDLGLPVQILKDSTEEDQMMFLYAEL